MEHQQEARGLTREADRRMVCVHAESTGHDENQLPLPRPMGLEPMRAVGDAVVSSHNID